MSIAKPKPVFELVFQGPGLVPEKIPIAKVAATLSAVRRLAAGEIAGDEDEDDWENTADAVRLVDVIRGSAVFRFVGPSPAVAIAHIKETGEVLKNPNNLGPSEYVLRPVKDLSAIARALECPIVLREPGRGGAVLATITGDSYGLISKSLLLDGDTSIAGRVMRVGGATEIRCGLRVAFQSRMLFCRVATADVARKLGDFLYQQVVVRGKAQWLKSSMRIFSFKVEDVYQPKSESILQSLGAIWEAGLKDWEKIEDPDAYLQEIRGKE
jgi:hypothetical protein